MRELYSKYPILLKLLPVLGISFWFLLLFPFGLRNEAYVWSAFFERFNIFEIIQNPIPDIKDNRPLAQLFAWILYQVSGKNGLLIQCFNFLLLGMAFIKITSIDGKNRRMLGSLYFLIGLVYISSFYYIFNLHGVFYSPILLFVSILIANSNIVCVKWKGWMVTTLILIFFHPFFAILFLGFFIGLCFEAQKFSIGRVISISLILIILCTLIRILIPGTILDLIQLKNLIGSMRNVEANLIIAIISILLSILTILKHNLKQRKILLLAFGAIIPLFLYYNVPFLLLIVILLMVQLLLEKRWGLLGLLCSSILFPLVVKSGAPTKMVIFLFLVPYLITRNMDKDFILKWFVPRPLIFAIVGIATTLIVLVRIGIEVPVFSALISPIIVEKGKTLQLERCIQLAYTDKSGKRIEFLQEGYDNIRDNGQPIIRDHFPPAKQLELDEYLKRLDTSVAWEMSPTWYISFGVPYAADSLELIHTLRELNLKPAYVYQPK